LLKCEEFEKSVGQEGLRRLEQRILNSAAESLRVPASTSKAESPKPSKRSRRRSPNVHSRALPFCDVRVGLPVGVNEARDLFGVSAEAPWTKTPVNTLDHYLPPITSAEKEKIDYHLCKWIYIADLPHDIGLTPEFQDFMGLLNPAYAAGGLPSKEEVVEVHERDVWESTLEFLLSMPAFTVTSDGWSDANWEDYYNILVCGLLFDIVHPFGPHGTSTNIDKKLIHLITKLRRECEERNRLPPGLIGVCTDKTAANVRMFEELVFYPDQELQDTFQDVTLVPYGCAAHALHMHGNDLCKLGSIPSVLAKAEVVAKVFRKVRLAKTFLNDVQEDMYGQTIELLLPVETRWLCVLQLLSSLVRSQSALRKLMNDFYEDLDGYDELNFKQLYGVDGKKNTLGANGEALSVFDILTDTMFWESVDALLWLLKPIGFCIHVLEGDVVPVSTVPLSWSYLYRFYRSIAEGTRDTSESTKDRLQALQLTPENFLRVTDGNDVKTLTRAKRIPDLLERRWVQMMCDSEMSRGGDGNIASGLFHLAFVMDKATFPMYKTMVKCNPQLRLDPHRALHTGWQEGLKCLQNLPALRAVEAKAAKLNHKLPNVIGHYSRAIISPQAPLRDTMDSLDLAHPLAQYPRESEPLASLANQFFAQENALECEPFASLANHLFRLTPTAAGGERSSFSGKRRNSESHTSLTTREKTLHNAKQHERERDMRAFERSKGVMLVFYSTESPAEFDPLKKNPIRTYLDLPKNTKYGAKIKPSRPAAGDYDDDISDLDEEDASDEDDDGY
jgi:hypothetical protein